eukprot:3563733-Rhodomonas_salina.1
MMCKDDVQLHKLPCGPLGQALLQWAFQPGVVASIIKTFASLPAVCLLAGCCRVQHSRHLLSDLQWAFRLGVVTDVCNLLWAFQQGVVTCVVLDVYFATCSRPFSLAWSRALF